jgi:hypothetical protein
MLDGKTAHEDCGGKRRGYSGHAGFLVEPRKHRSDGDGDGRDHDARGDVEPEERAHLGLLNVAPLDGCHRKPHVFENGRETDDDGGHRDQSEVFRREQTGKNRHRYQREQQLRALAPQRHRSATHRAPAQVGRQVIDPEESLRVDRGRVGEG